jgi:hypothetical protein
VSDDIAESRPLTAAPVTATAPAAPLVPAWDRRRDRRVAALLFVLVWIVYLATATYWVGQMNDTRATTQSAWSLATRGTLALPEAWRGEIDWEVEGADGRPYTNRFPGPTLWAAPFHVVGDMLFPRPAPSHPHLLNYAPSGVAAATGAALAVLLSYLGFRQLADRRTAVGAALVLAFGTSVWSVSADIIWTHTVTHLALALGILAMAHERHIAGGLAFGAAILSRPHLAIVPAVVGIWGGVRQRRLRPVLEMGLASALGLLAIVLYSRILFGTWLPISGYNDYAVRGLAGTPTREFVERFVRYLVDPTRGFFIYTPLLLVLVPFVHRGWRASPWWARSAAVSGVAYLLIQMRANTYSGGAQYFGSRLTLETLVLCAPLLLRTWQVSVARLRVVRVLAWTLIAVSVGLHALGATIWRSPFNDLEGAWREHLEEVCAEPDVVGCDGPMMPGEPPD